MHTLIAALLRHNGMVFVRRYAHLSPSHLQDKIEKVAAFGRVISREAQKEQPEHSSAEEQTGKDEAVEGQQPTISVPTMTGTVTETNQR